MYLGEKIRRIRKMYRMTLEQVSHETGASISQLSDIERGVSMPSLKRCEQIAECFGINLSALLSGVVIGEPKDSAPDAPAGR